MCDCNFNVEADKARVRSDILDHLEEIEGLMRAQTALSAMSIRMALNPPETEEERRALHEKLDDIGDRGHWFD